MIGYPSYTPITETVPCSQAHPMADVLCTLPHERPVTMAGHELMICSMCGCVVADREAHTRNHTMTRIGL